MIEGKVRICIGRGRAIVLRRIYSSSAVSVALEKRVQVKGAKPVYRELPLTEDRVQALQSVIYELGVLLAFEKPPS